MRYGLRRTANSPLTTSSVLSRRLAIAISIAIAIAVVPIVVMVAIAVHTTVGHSDIQRTIEAEGHHGIPRNPNRLAAHLSSRYSSYDRPDQAVIALRFHSVWLGSNRISLPINHHRFQIEDEVVVGSHSDHQLRVGPTGNGDAPAIAADILVHCPIINAVVPPLDIDSLIQTHRNHRAGHDFRVAPLALIPIAIMIDPVAILPPRRGCNKDTEESQTDRALPVS